MTVASDGVRRFFDEFERNTNGGDAGAIAAQFADVFMNADPNGAAPVPKSAFLAALPQREKLFASIGCRPAHHHARPALR